jgi:VanZ family protein
LSRTWALGFAVAVTLCVSTGTEIYQVLLADRNASLVDFLANWLGVFMVGFGVSFAGNMLEKVGR